MARFIAEWSVNHILVKTCLGRVEWVNFGRLRQIYKYALLNERALEPVA